MNLRLRIYLPVLACLCFSLSAAAGQATRNKQVPTKLIRVVARFVRADVQHWTITMRNHAGNRETWPISEQALSALQMQQLKPGENFTIEFTPGTTSGFPKIMFAFAGEQGCRCPDAAPGGASSNIRCAGSCPAGWHCASIRNFPGWHCGCEYP